jgi:hypothetical protein
VSADRSRKCAWCGAAPGSACRGPNDEPTPTHAYRRARRLGLVKTWAKGPSCTVDLDELAAIRGGARCAQERILWAHAQGNETSTMLMSDADILHAWHVRVACACLIRVDAKRGEPIAHELLTRWPWPVRMALAPPRSIKRLLEPLGLVAMRAGLIHFASTLAVEGAISADQDEAPYTRQAVALLILRDTRETPHDKVLRAVRERMLRQGEVTT